MERQEFLNRLRAALNGRIPAAMVEEHLNFYQDYINKEIRKGRTEEDVLAELGDPRLIARTILDTATQPVVHTSAESEERGDTTSAHGFTAQTKGRLAVLICVIVLLVVLSIVLSVLSAFLPLILVIVGVLVLVKIFRDFT